MIGYISRHLREKNNLTVAELARRLSINRATLFRFEKGEKNLSEELVVRVLSELKLKREAIFNSLVILELFHLRDRFKDLGVDKQILDVLRKFDTSDEGEQFMCTYFTTQLNN
ncbi:helix-turn-helix domain-containing protein [Patescibacteria group bacterium]|nr:helix-turn-helix domain-containing protein [Patescibacteria group bacterium]